MTQITVVENPAVIIKATQQGETGAPGTVRYDTYAELSVALAHIADTIGFVTDDPDTTKNGEYVKSGVSGSGSWAQISRFLTLSSPVGAWGTSTAYVLRDLVTESGVVYICVEAHTSGTFATDLSAGKWAIYQGLTQDDVTDDPETGKIPTWDGLTRLGYADLQAIPTGALTDGWTVNLAYRATLGDGGGGQFYWNSSDLSTDVAANEINVGEGDGYDFIAPATDKTGLSGAWVLQDSRPLPLALVDLGAIVYKGQKIYHQTDIFEYEFQALVTYTPSVISILKDIELGNVRLSSVARKNGSKFTYPVSWTGPTPNVYWRADGRWLTDVDSRESFRETYMVKSTDPNAAGGATYYVSPNGDNSDGLTPATAYNALATAYAEADCLTIMLEGGYPYIGFPNSGIDRSINFIGYGSERAIIFNYGRAPVFAANATYPTTVFEITDTLEMERPSNVILKDENGLPVVYKQVASVLEVSQTPLSYYKDSLTTYVHATSQPIIGQDIFITLESWYQWVFSTANDNSDSTIYTENLIWPNGVRSLSNTGGNWYALNCAAVATQDSNNWIITGQNTIFKDCFAVGSADDGFNYTDGTSIEINCKSYNTGDGGGSTQGSTSHGSALTLRIGGEYESAGQNSILDVGTGQTINLGVKAGGKSVSDSFNVAASRNMWCFDCQPSGVSTGDHYDNAGTGTFIIDGNISGILTGGTVTLAGE